MVLEHWKENVTHVVAATNDLGGCSRTVKFIKAILTGKWILTIECEWQINYGFVYRYILLSTMNV